MPEHSKLWYLKNFNLLDGLNKTTMQRLSHITTMSTLRSHQPIYFPDEPSRSIFFLKKGHVKISRITSEGNEVILDVMGPGEIFGELSLIDDIDQRNEIAYALDDVLICAIRKGDFESLLKSNPDLNIQITKLIGLRLRKFEERVTELIFKDVRKRIASFLVRYGEEAGKMKAGVVNIRMHLSHRDIALLTGSARQTATTTLNEFRSMGLIDFSRKGITIKQFEKLQLLAK